jgi:hypothetical protein
MGVGQRCCGTLPGLSLGGVTHLVRKAGWTAAWVGHAIAHQGRPLVSE